eukprot:gene724-8976_t
MTKPETKVHTLIVLGDIIETWLTGYDEQPMPVEEIFKHENLYNANIKEFMQTLEKISKNNIHVVILKGNHDDNLKASDFKNFNFTFVEDVFIQGNVRYQHGHQYDLFNAPDPAGLRSFGYYMSRSVSHTGGKKSMIPSTAKSICRAIIHRFPVLSKYLIDDKINSVFLKNLVDTALKGTFIGKFKGLSSYSAYRNHKIQGGCYWFSSSSDSVKLGLAVRKYNGLVKRLLRKYPIEYVSNMIAGTCNDFSYFITHFKERIAIFGHTHIHKFLNFVRHSSLGGGVVTYVNSGSWTDQTKEKTIVRLIQPDINKTPKHIQLIKIDDEKEIIINEESIKESSVQLRIPKNFTCDRSFFNDEKICHCNCSHFDIDCLNLTLPIHGCEEKEGKKLSFCSEQSNCIYHQIDQSVPKEWSCPPEFYGTDDGCDCSCGAPDPDCKNDNQCNFKLLFMCYSFLQ